MEDYENNRMEENDAGNAPAETTSDSFNGENRAENEERTDAPEGASAGNGYTYHPDGT